MKQRKKSVTMQAQDSVVPVREPRTVEEFESSHQILFRQQLEDYPDDVLQVMLKNIYELRKVAPHSLAASQARDIISSVLQERATRPPPPPPEPEPLPSLADQQHSPLQELDGEDLPAEEFGQDLGYSEAPPAGEGGEDYAGHSPSAEEPWDRVQDSQEDSRRPVLTSIDLSRRMGAEAEDDDVGDTSADRSSRRPRRARLPAGVPPVVIGAGLGLVVIVLVLAGVFFTQ